MKRGLFTLVSIAAGALCMFFAWYTVRLAWVNMTVAGAARHRQTGMYIGAVAFPAAALLFGYISHWCRIHARGMRS